MSDKLKEINAKLRSLGCTNHYCLVQPLKKGSMGTGGSCKCYDPQDKTPLEFQTIFRNKAAQYNLMLAKIEELEAKLSSVSNFPTMLRKAWSGDEVQAWINKALENSDDSSRCS